MSKLFEQIERDRKHFYKERYLGLRDDVTTDILTVVIGDIQNKTKTPTDEDTVKVLKANLKQVDKFIEMTGGDKSSLREKEVLESYLPKKINKVTLQLFIDKLIKDGIMDNILEGRGSQGKFMGLVKKEFGERADMKMASDMYKGLFENA
jgi:uncharacterized protein YqeY